MGTLVLHTAPSQPSARWPVQSEARGAIRSPEEKRNEATTAKTTTSSSLSEKYARVLEKYRTLKSNFRRLSEDYDYNFELFKERDEELESLEDRLKREKAKTKRMSERIVELEREVALRTTTAGGNSVR